MDNRKMISLEMAREMNTWPDDKLKEMIIDQDCDFDARIAKIREWIDTVLERLGDE